MRVTMRRMPRRPSAASSATIGTLTPIASSANASPRVRQNLALIYGLQGDHVRAEALGRVDLAAADAQANLRFFDFMRARNH